MTSVRIESLHVYPVKSLRGVDLVSATLKPPGLEHDRSFMITRPDGRFVTQREVHQLALIRAGLSADGLTLSRDGQGAVTLPPGAGEGPVIRSRVWRDHCEVVDCGEEISTWLTRAIDDGNEYRLVRMAEGFGRRHHNAERFGASASTLFADAAPFLVANLASLAQLNRELQARGLDAVPMNRFRPNVVISGLQAFAEHHLAGLQNGHCALKFHDACERCIVTTIDQETGRRDPLNQPFATLKVINPVPGKPPAPAFGQNASLARGDGQKLRVGDTLAASRSQEL